VVRSPKAMSTTLAVNGCQNLIDPFTTRTSVIRGKLFEIWYPRAPRTIEVWLYQVWSVGAPGERILFLPKISITIMIMFAFLQHNKYSLINHAMPCRAYSLNINFRMDLLVFWLCGYIFIHRSLAGGTIFVYRTRAIYYMSPRASARGGHIFV
jgi:hypothetical protein